MFPRGLLILYAVAYIVTSKVLHASEAFGVASGDVGGVPPARGAALLDAAGAVLSDACALGSSPPSSSEVDVAAAAATAAAAAAANASEGVRAALNATAGGGASWLRQVSILTERNRNLQFELEELRVQVEKLTSSSLAERRAIVESERATEEARLKAAEVELKRAQAASKAAIDAAQAAELEKLHSMQASSAVQAALGERRSVLAAELETSQNKLTAAELALQQAKIALQQTDKHIALRELDVSRGEGGGGITPHLPSRGCGRRSTVVLRLVGVVDSAFFQQ